MIILNLSVSYYEILCFVISELRLIKEEKEKTIYNDIQMELRNPYIHTKRRER